MEEESNMEYEDILKMIQEAVGTIRISGGNFKSESDRKMIPLNSPDLIKAIIDDIYMRREFSKAVKKRELESEEQTESRKRNIEKETEKIESYDKVLEDPKLKEKLTSALEYIQNLYLEAFEKLSDNAGISPMQISNGVVQASKDMVSHSTYANGLKGISHAGIIASEWFGVLESELEDRFCTSFVREDLTNEQLKESLKRKERIVIFVDSKNPVACSLLRLDYFEYAYEKRNNLIPDGKYSQDQINMFEHLIDPMSPAGGRMRDFERTRNWIAIPGGIPPQLINGIGINSQHPDFQGIIDTCSKLFPNATIFDEELRVLEYPRNRSIETIQIDEKSIKEIFVKAKILEELFKCEQFQGVEPDKAKLYEEEKSKYIGEKPQLSLREMIEMVQKSDRFDLFVKTMNDIEEDVIYPSDIHGISHNERVALLAFSMGVMENLDDRDMKIIIEASKYHDIGREDDQEDYRHGERSAEQIDKLNLKLPDEDMKILRVICKCHSLEDKNFEDIAKLAEVENLERCRKLFEILKDADALDRTRFRYYSVLNSSYLRTDVGKRLVLASYELVSNYNQIVSNKRSEKRSEKLSELVEEARSLTNDVEEAQRIQAGYQQLNEQRVDSRQMPKRIRSRSKTTGSTKSRSKTNAKKNTE